MIRKLDYTLPNMLELTDPTLMVTTANGRVIPSVEYYDGALSGWSSDDPYVQLSDLEDAMAGRGYSSSKKKTATNSPARDTDLFIRRPVVPSDELIDVLQAIAPFHNPNRGTRCHKPGLDLHNGLHATVLNTRGMKGIELPDEESFDAARRVPILGQRLGKLSLEGAELLVGNPNYHLVLIFVHKAIARLREERIRLEQEHFPRLRLQQTANSQIFRPHVTVLSASDRTVAEQALAAVRSRASIPKRIDLAPARHSYYQTRYADLPS